MAAAAAAASLKPTTQLKKEEKALYGNSFSKRENREMRVPLNLSARGITTAISASNHGLARGVQGCNYPPQYFPRVT